MGVQSSLFGAAAASAPPPVALRWERREEWEEQEGRGGGGTARIWRSPVSGKLVLSVDHPSAGTRCLRAESIAQAMQMAGGVLAQMITDGGRHVR
ncbi:MAG: hypothetical protein B7Y12_02070 [Rhizobiales bacterium 24-66-13]|jgi:hypothetical protein|nr:MAG: hypothetical protein B7Y61_01100 [Rhizobiales bacterium 35-66-30]OYZ82802.1 MAG: hypothetical protein B7Y12_02070 [Rhizobiales bacterium 24-66-13]OZB11835.1 MAG: hypothetical protein B7X67_02050 [Rhizobiales bacterium 39-66-18]HQS09493.1 hypothetical protein [Xanthobacteraceae bacterium]HQS45942.1 hypothetical protein [Xanthobacteraceae bacterium]